MRYLPYLLLTAACGATTAPAPLLTDASTTDSGGEPASGPPEKLAFYYSYPSLVNGSNGNVAMATQAFKDYDVVVFGDGLDAATHPDHANTAAIIAGLGTATRVYGYIDLCVQVANVPCTNLSDADIQAKADRWKAMGVVGVFLDQAGYDYAVSRTRLNTAVDYLHQRGLSAFVNPWVPDDVFSAAVDATFNPAGTATHLGAADYVLDESFAIDLSQYQDPAQLVAKSEKLVAARKQFGTKVATTNTLAATNPPFDPAQLDYGFWLTVLYGFDAMAWGETATYSSDTAQLPFHPRPPLASLGASGEIAVTTVGHRLSRATSERTIQVDLDAHVGWLAPTPVFDQRAAQPGQLVKGEAEITATETTLRLSSASTPITAYRIYVDADNTATTGFQHGLNPGLGADFMVENGILYRFTGATQTTFAWDQVGPVTDGGRGTPTVQVMLSATQLPPTSPTIAILGENVGDGFATLDVLPRGPAVWQVKR